MEEFLTMAFTKMIRSVGQKMFKKFEFESVVAGNVD